MGECSFWYRPTRVVPDQRPLNGRCCSVVTFCTSNDNTMPPIAHRISHETQKPGPLSRTTRVSRYQKGKTNLDFTEARDSEWQWQQLGRMQVCTSLQTDNHTSTPPLSFYRPDALPATKPTASTHSWRKKTRSIWKSSGIII